MARPTPSLHLPDLSSSRALVTGASDGMGLRIAQRLAAAGAHVIMPVRSRAKGNAAADTIRGAVPGARVVVRDLDLASLGSIAALGAALRAEGEPLTMLIGNAGLMTPPTRQETADGLELQFGTNFLGHFALVGHLMPLLRAGNARVTSQLSIAANRGVVLWDDLQSEREYTPMAAYGSSKVAYGLFGLELQRRSDAGGWGITSNLSHPGVAPTNLLAAQPGFGRTQETREIRVIRLMSRIGLAGTPESAALPALLAATSPAAAPSPLYGPMGPGRVSGKPGNQKLFASLRSPDDARRIWEIADDLVASRSADWPGFPG